MCDIPTLATLTSRSGVSSEIRHRLRRLAEGLFQPKFSLQDSSISPEYLRIHGIERHASLPWREEDESDPSLSFATRLDTTLLDKAFKDTFTEDDELSWPDNDLIIDGRFISAHQLAESLRIYTNHISYYIPTLTWRPMK